jgi:hypothetical protein
MVPDSISSRSAQLAAVLELERITEAPSRVLRDRWQRLRALVGGLG